MRRLALGLSITGCLLVPVTSEALGLGSVEVQTSLNQPLQASIGIRDLGAADLSGISATLAPQNLFQRLGIPRPDYLSELNFKIVHTAAGGAKILVTTQQPIQQPFLDFLLEVNWSGGSLLREYTILLNPPNYMEGQAEASVQTPTAVRAPATPQPAVTPLSNSSPAPVSRVRSPSKPQPAPMRTTHSVQRLSPMHPVAGRYHVVRGDTLWSIAQHEGAVSVGSINRMMIGILRENPRAFIQGNINGLKTGYVLRIPSKSSLSGINAGKAAAEITTQNALWHQYAQRLSGKAVPENTLKPTGKAAAPKPVATGKPKTSGDHAPANAHLKILGTEAKTAANPPNPNASSVNKPADHQLALANEALASNKEQIGTLQTRINDLQGIVAKQQKLLQVKSQELSALQAKLGKSSTQATAEQAPVPGAVAAATATKPSTTAGPSQTASPAAKPAAPGPAAHTTPVAKPITKPAAHQEPVPNQPRGFLQTLLNNPNYLMAAGLVALLLLALIWLAVRRSAKSPTVPPIRGIDPLDDLPATDEHHDGPVEPVIGGVAAASMVAASALVAEEANKDVPEEAGEPADPDVADDLGELPDFHAAEPASEEDNTQNQDVLAEADVYMAYGLYPQAETLLTKALADHPDHQDYRAKLLECYYSETKPEDFEREAQVFYDGLPAEARSGEQWLRIATLGQALCPETALFADTDTAGMSPEDVLKQPGDVGGLDLGEADEAPQGHEINLEDGAGLDLGDDDALEEQAVDLGDTEQEAAHTVTEPAEGTEESEDLAFDVGELDVGEADAFEEHELDLGDLDPAHASAASESEGGAYVLDDLDLGTDEDSLSLDDADELDLSELELPEAGQAGESPVSEKAEVTPDLSADSLDLNLDDFDLPETTTSTDLEAPELDMEALDFGSSEEEAPAIPHSDVAEPDLSGLDFDLDVSDEEKALLAEPDTTTESELPVIDPEPATVIQAVPPEEEESHVISDGDSISTKLDLARAYMDMGDEEGAESTLQEVMSEGSPEQQKEAEALLKQIG